jgi:phage baseplate assembly protein W
MRGMSATTGKALEGTAHLVQSIADILGTPLGSRVMRRDYGSLLPRLIDQPLTGATRLRVYAAVATALMRWEPRLRLTSVGIDLGDVPGQVVVTIQGARTDVPADPATVLTVPLQLRA